jgi:hypothetical protein
MQPAWPLFQPQVAEVVSIAAVGVVLIQPVVGLSILNTPILLRKNSDTPYSIS